MPDKNTILTWARRRSHDQILFFRNSYQSAN